MEKTYYFIGVGGVGMSAIALYLLKRGAIICGSDVNDNYFTQILKKFGAKIFVGHDKQNIPSKVDFCVVNSAIEDGNVEVVEFLRRGTKILSRSELLGRILSNFEKSIAVAGTHGKTTTTALLFSTLKASGIDAELFLGGVYKGKNYVNGAGKVAIAEACEYKNSFLRLSPHIAVVLNVEYDHVDCFKNLEEVQNAFVNFCKRAKIVVAEKIFATFLKKQSPIAKIIDFGVECELDSCDVVAKDLCCKEGVYSFDLYEKSRFVKKVCLSAEGKHMVYCALASFAVARVLGLSAGVVAKKLSTFVGVDRRWQVFESNYTNVVADYAHHPTEIKNLIFTAKQKGFEKIFVLFQPHTFSRTQALREQFATCFCGAQKVVLLPVFSARETSIAGGNSDDLAKSLLRHTPCVVVENFEQAKAQLAMASKKDLLLVVGAGDVIDFCAPKYLNK